MPRSDCTCPICVAVEEKLSSFDVSAEEADALREAYRMVEDSISMLAQLVGDEKFCHNESASKFFFCRAMELTIVKVRALAEKEQLAGK